MIENTKKRVLVVEDEKHIADGLKLNLNLKGYDALISADGIKALRDWKEWKPDLIILDIMLPGIDGLSVLQNIRLEDEKIPILILSAKNTNYDKIKGLSYGVDDYLTKPFNLDELLLRIDRLLKRVSWNSKENFNSADENLKNYTFGNNKIDFINGTAACKQGKINLTEQELKILKLFIANENKPISRDKLLEVGWGYSKGTNTRTVDNFIVRFRKYFEQNPKKPLFFSSLRAFGYIFNPQK